MGLLYSHYEANPITNNSLKINAVCGTLTKTFKDSYFVRFEKGSSMECFYFREDKPSRILSKRQKSYYSSIPNKDEEEFKDYIYRLKEVVVLQVMLCSDNNYLVEAIDKEKYNEIFGIEIKENLIVEEDNE